MTDHDQNRFSSPGQRQDRRAHPRVKVSAPVELHVEGSGSPIRGATCELSLGGCYIETMFPLPKGTTLDLKLRIDTTLLIMASVVTCDPQVGNGIKFTKMLAEDREALETHLAALQQAQDPDPTNAG